MYVENDPKTGCNPGLGLMRVAGVVGAHVEDREDGSGFVLHNVRQHGATLAPGEAKRRRAGDAHAKGGVAAHRHGLGLGWLGDHGRVADHQAGRLAEDHFRRVPDRDRIISFVNGLRVGDRDAAGGGARNVRAVEAPLVGDGRSGTAGRDAESDSAAARSDSAAGLGQQRQHFRVTQKIREHLIVALIAPRHGPRWIGVVGFLQ